MKTKKCSNCFCEKPLSDFYVKRRKYWGGVKEDRQARCKACNREVVLSYEIKRRLEKGLRLTKTQQRYLLSQAC